MSEKSDFKRVVPQDLEFIKNVIQDPERILTNKMETFLYSMDGVLVENRNIPDMVVLVESIREISALLEYANTQKIPVTPRGSGTSLSGGPLARYGGIILDCSRMRNIEEISIEKNMVICEPGVVCDTLNSELNKQGYFFPPDPGSSSVASIGGMIANNAGGVQAFKYGTTKDYVLWLQVVLANGEIKELGSKTLKSNSSYNLTGLFCGSEGTFGVITKVALRIKPLPPFRQTAFYIFKDIYDIQEVIIELRKQGIMPNLQEYLDKTTAQVCYQHLGGEYLKYPEGYVLILEVDGGKAQVKEDFAQLKAICLEKNPIFHKEATDPKNRDEIIAARKAALPALAQLSVTTLIEDCTINIDRWADAVISMEKITEKIHGTKIKIATFGHLEGNIHPTILFNERDQEQVNDFHQIMDILYKDIVIPAGGTITGEHGIGYVKAPYLFLEHGDVMPLMEQIKAVFDPNNILNPGKGKGCIINQKEDLIKKQTIPESLIDINCIRCGFCLETCPTYQMSLSQVYSPRGRIILLKGVLRGQIQVNADLQKALLVCTLCGQCQAKCPAGVDTLEIFENMREHLYNSKKR